MNVLEFVLLVSTGVVVLAIGIDGGHQIWLEKQEKKEAHQTELREAEAILRASIIKRFRDRMEDDATIELKVVELPKKSGGRHRLTAA